MVFCGGLTLYQKNDYVYWTFSSKGKQYERAGEVCFIVPPYENPKKYVPSYYTFFSRGTKTRDVVSFLIRVPGSKVLYWPPLESLQPLPLNKWDILYSQKTRIRTKDYSMIDRTDREKIIKICSLIEYIYGDRYFENDNFITVPMWGKRFWFGIKNRREYLKKVEEFTPIMGGGF